MSNLSEATVWQAPASQPQARLQLVDAPALLPAVVFHGVSKQFLPGGDAPRALQQVDLEISRGSIFGIIGRSGAGKSTLLRLVNRLEAPSSGTVRVNGIDVLGLDADQLVLLRRRIGMVFQHFNLLSAKTVWENVALPLKIAGVPKAQIRKKVDALLDLVGLSEKRDCPPGRLSGGQKQRVGIARALVHDPDILLCDEATSALDPETTQAILALLKDIRRRLGLTIILITHEMAVIREVCDNVAVLEGGRVVESGAVWQVFGDPQHAATRGLLRPLVHDLPAEWATRLQRLDDGPVPGAPQASVLLDLRFTGGAREADVGALFNALAVHSPKVRLIHGALEPIQGHLQGRLVLSAELPAQLPPERAYRALLEVARGAADQAEALGYV